MSRLFHMSAARSAQLRKKMADSIDHIDARGCWVWGGLLKSHTKYNQYGRLKVLGFEHGAHRLALYEHLGGIVIGLHVLHTCDNQRRVNPEHLWLGTRDENMRDMVAKRRNSPQRGEVNNSARLTERQAIAILADSRRHSVIARYHGVSTSAVSMIKARLNWRHLPNPAESAGAST